MNWVETSFNGTPLFQLKRGKRTVEIFITKMEWAVIYYPSASTLSMKHKNGQKKECPYRRVGELATDAKIWDYHDWEMTKRFEEIAKFTA